MTIEQALELSSADKESALQSLSVWVARLTTPQQAQKFMGEKQTQFTHYFVLHVEAVRNLPLHSVPVSYVLDVVYDPEGVSLENKNLPGVEGHAGITGLLKPPGMPR